MKIHDMESGTSEAEVLNQMFKRKVKMNNPTRAQVQIFIKQEI